MKKIIIVTIALLCSVSCFAQKDSFAQKKKVTPVKVKTSCKSKKVASNLPPRGGRTKMPEGIEGHKINFGFSVGGSLALMDALNKEKAFIGGRGTIFIHAIIPNTKTFAVGFEGGVTYLLANQVKYKETLLASTRDGALATSKEAEVVVSNWMLPTAQLSFIGNFHPVHRFNVQIKGNIGSVLSMGP
jgi:hypothetical protein